MVFLICDSFPPSKYAQNGPQGKEGFGESKREGTPTAEAVSSDGAPECGDCTVLPPPSASASPRLDARVLEPGLLDPGLVPDSGWAVDSGRLLDWGEVLREVVAVPCAVVSTETDESIPSRARCHMEGQWEEMRRIEEEDIGSENGWGGRRRRLISEDRWHGGR